MRWALLIALAAAATAHADLNNHLTSPLLLGPGQAIAVSVAKSLPIPAASSGITFTFDPRTSAFERETEVLGQVYLERAHPIGKGRLNFNLTYQYVDTNRLDGNDLHFSESRPIRDDPSGILYVIPKLDFEVVTQETMASVTYGVTDDLDVNLALPVLYSRVETSGRLVQVPGGEVQRGSSDDTAVGVGDIMLRGKYRLLRGWLGELAAALVFRLPSGDEDNLQGTGLFEVSPYLYASTPPLTLGPRVRVQGHFNAGLDLTPQDSSQGEGRFGVGIDVMLASRATLSVAFLGREPFDRLLDPRFVNVTFADGSRGTIFGLDTGRPSYYDLSIGGRIDLWRDTVFGIVNVLVPVNQDGVRASVVPLVGIEVAY